VASSSRQVASALVVNYRKETERYEAIFDLEIVEALEVHAAFVDSAPLTKQCVTTLALGAQLQ
jgi:hypothetical protein